MNYEVKILLHLLLCLWANKYFRQHHKHDILDVSVYVLESFLFSGCIQLWYIVCWRSRDLWGMEGTSHNPWQRIIMDIIKTKFNDCVAIYITFANSIQKKICSTKHEQKMQWKRITIQHKIIAKFIYSFRSLFTQLVSLYYKKTIISRQFIK